MQTTKSTPRAIALTAIAILCAVTAAPAAAMTEAERAFLAEQEQVQRELLSLQMQVRVLEQRAKVGELERKIRDANAPPAPPAPNPAMFGGFPMMPGGAPIDLRGMPPMAGVPGMPGMPGAAPGMPMPSLEPEIRLLSVYGFRGEFNADMQVGERRVRVAVGDALNEAWRVSAIGAGQVTLVQIAPQRPAGAAQRGGRQAAPQAPRTRVIGL